MQHIFKQGEDQEKPIMLLLHGTGGTEKDLIPIAEEIDPTASVLSVRGNVLERGMPRFFRRLAEGVFEEDLLFRTDELNQFIGKMAKKQGFNRKNVVAVGYSNGANIASSLLFHYQDVLKGAILFHPMVPRRGVDLPDLRDVPIFIGAGKNDPICPAQETRELAEIFTEAKANVHVHWENDGHQLTRKEISAAKSWYEKIFI